MHKLYEEKIREEVTIPGYYFAAQTFVPERMLYSFLNVDDELAFVRLKPILEE